MLDLKLKMLERKLYEQIVEIAEENNVPDMFICLILKNIENKFQENTIANLSYRLLKKEQEKINNE